MDEFKIRNMVFLEKDREKTIEIKGEKFVIKALFPIDKRAITNSMVTKQGGLPSSSFDDIGLYLIEREATVDVAIKESPPSWTNASECPEEETLDLLFKQISDWTNEFQEKLKKNQLNKRSEKGAVPS